MIGYADDDKPIPISTIHLNFIIRDWTNTIMGARTNYTIVTTNNPLQNINVYAHWDGEHSVASMQNAIKAAMPRINDMSYGARIIIDQLTKHGRDSEAGYGIYVGEVDHEEEYEYKEINLLNKTVTVGQMTFAIDQFVEVLA